MYQPIYYPEKIEIGSGQIIYVTGWTPVGVVKKKVSDYAAIGQLYNPHRSVDYLLANLFANPDYRNLILISATKEDENLKGCAIDVLYHILIWGKDMLTPYKNEFGMDRLGVKRNDVIIGSINPMFFEDLESLQDGLNWSRFHSVDEAVEAGSTPPFNLKLPSFRQRKVFTIPIVTSDILPAKLAGYTIDAQTVGQAWLQAVKIVRKHGRMSGARQELIAVTSVIHAEPEDLHIEEWMPTNRQKVEEYLPTILESTGEVEGSYRYGTRLRSPYDQIKAIEAKLQKDINNTQSYASTWRPEEDYALSTPPCLVGLWFHYVDNRLVLCVQFRSHDMYDAYCDNLLALRKLQYKVAHAVGVEVGELCCTSLSAHIYNHAFEDADRLVSNYKPKINYDDPVGNFTIEVGATVSVTQTNSSGEVVMAYEGKNPLKLLREICDANHSIQPAHSGYLGMELGRAQDALQRNEQYKQDRL